MGMQVQSGVNNQPSFGSSSSFSRAVVKYAKQYGEEYNYLNKAKPMITRELNQPNNKKMTVKFLLDKKNEQIMAIATPVIKFVPDAISRFIYRCQGKVGVGISDTWEHGYVEAVQTACHNLKLRVNKVAVSKVYNNAVKENYKAAVKDFS